MKSLFAASAAIVKTTYKSKTNDLQPLTALEGTYNMLDDVGQWLVHAIVFFSRKMDSVGTSPYTKCCQRLHRSAQRTKHRGAYAASQRMKWNEDSITKPFRTTNQKHHIIPTFTSRDNAAFAVFAAAFIFWTLFACASSFSWRVGGVNLLLNSWNAKFARNSCFCFGLSIRNCQDVRQRL